MRLKIFNIKQKIQNQNKYVHVYLHLQLLFKQLENVKMNEYVISIALETALRTSSYSQRNITYVLALMPKGLVARIQVSVGRLI